MQITSNSIKDGETFNNVYTCEGADISPELKWNAAPDKTLSFALIVDDPDAPMGTWVHWLVYNIPATQTSLDENLSEAVMQKLGIGQGLNSFNKESYGGPCPPKGHGVHHYHFKLYALSATLMFGKTPDKADIEKAMQGHIIAQTEIVPVFKRD